MGKIPVIGKIQSYTMEFHWDPIGLPLESRWNPIGMFFWQLAAGAWSNGGSDGIASAAWVPRQPAHLNRDSRPRSRTSPARSQRPHTQHATAPGGRSSSSGGGSAGRGIDRCQGCRERDSAARRRVRGHGCRSAARRRGDRTVRDGAHGWRLHRPGGRQFTEQRTRRFHVQGMNFRPSARFGLVQQDPRLRVEYISHRRLPRMIVTPARHIKGSSSPRPATAA